MTNNRLFRTNLLICVILVGGFLLTAFFSNRANYRISLTNIEQISTLSMDGIYYQLSSMLMRPVNIAVTMAQDRLLIEHLRLEEKNLDDPAYLQTIKSYLEAYYKKYHFDTVFLVSTATGRYYNFAGIERVISENTPENAWYYKFLTSPNEYSLNVDNDAAVGEKEETAVFVNCKVADQDGKIIGIVGVGIRTNYLARMLKSYEDKYDVEAFLIDGHGNIQVSTTHRGDNSQNLFKIYGLDEIGAKILNNKIQDTNLGLWASPDNEDNNSIYIVSRYIPELKWHLIVEHNTSKLMQEIKLQLLKSSIILILIITSVLLVITYLIKNFNKKITGIIEQRQAIFKEATERLYDNIYEWNITSNRCVGTQTEKYFENINAKNFSYEDGLKIISEKQIKKEFRAGYLSLFNRENILREFDKGNNHLTYDFMITQDGHEYHWIRIDAHIFHSPEDESIHMFTYRKNIDAEKQKEYLANIDEMTKCYTKKATERMIDNLLTANSKTEYAFFIFDLDNFKTVNDSFGHAFGDMCIKTFSSIIKKHFREHDIVGRLGGDEFAAFIPIPDITWAEAKAKELSESLDTQCLDNGMAWHLSASIGVSLAPRDGSNFSSLYKCADKALYHTKQHGKNGFTINLQ